MSDREKDQKLQPVSNVLQSLFTKGKSPLSDQFLRWRLWSTWHEVVGEEMAQYSTPVGFYDGTILIWVRTAAHMQEMNYGRELLRNRINQFVGFSWVKLVKFTVDRKDVPQQDEATDQFKSFLK